MPSSCRSRTARAVHRVHLAPHPDEGAALLELGQQLPAPAASRPSARPRAAAVPRGVAISWGTRVDALRVHGDREGLAVAVEDGAAARVEVDRALALARGLALEGRAAQHLELDQAHQHDHRPQADARAPPASGAGARSRSRGGGRRRPGASSGRSALRSARASSRRSGSRRLRHLRALGRRRRGLSTTTSRSGAAWTGPARGRRSPPRAAGSRAWPSPGAACGSPRSGARARGRAARPRRARSGAARGAARRRGRGRPPARPPGPAAARGRGWRAGRPRARPASCRWPWAAGDVAERRRRPRVAPHAASPLAAPRRRALRARGFRGVSVVGGPQRLPREQREASRARPRKALLHLAVLEAVERDHRQAAAGGQARRAMARSALAQALQLAVHVDAQRLEGAGGGIEAGLARARRRPGARSRPARWWCGGAPAARASTMARAMRREARSSP